MAIVEDWESLARKAGYHSCVLACHCQSSVRQLERFFRDRFGQSPQEWLDAARLKRATALLLEGRPVKEVAFEVGFKHPSHFIRWFRSWLECTPMSFAIDPAMCGRAPHALAPSAGQAASLEP
jgi:AraC-like DNA-binding protein